MAVHYTAKDVSLYTCMYIFLLYVRSYIDASSRNYARIGVLYYGQTGNAREHIGLTRYSSEFQKANFQAEVTQTPFLNQPNTDVSGALQTAHPGKCYSLPENAEVRTYPF